MPARNRTFCPHQTGTESTDQLQLFISSTYKYVRIVKKKIMYLENRVGLKFSSLSELGEKIRNIYSYAKLTTIPLH